jgi:hypothetical protein
MNAKNINNLGSFRDPSGFIFYNNDIILRQVCYIYKEHYDHLMDSGLYNDLVDKGLLISHIETSIEGKLPESSYKVIQPELIPFISYPYEWSFSQLKEAALATIEIQSIALNYGMILKDASAFNIQFLNGKAVLIDTLSFEIYEKGEPWVAYRQFCQHFLAPLALISHIDLRFGQLSKNFIDGIPTDLASKLLPNKTYLKFSLLIHIHLHSKSEKRYSDKKANIKKSKINLISLLALMDSLKTSVKSLKCKLQSTEWADYYEHNNNYCDNATQSKEKIVEDFLKQVKPKKVWDLGANTGKYSLIASNEGAMTVSFDSDIAAVEMNYLQNCKKSKTNILPLFLDLTNPTPAIGWNNRERMSLSDRGPVDVIIALALIHHIAISNNMPLYMIADLFYSNANWLIIEFVPKEDSNCQKLLKNRKDIFATYTEVDFKDEFNKYFKLVKSEKIMDSKRTLYLMEKRNNNE